MRTGGVFFFRRILAIGAILAVFVVPETDGASGKNAHKGHAAAPATTDAKGAPGNSAATGKDAGKKPDSAKVVRAPENPCPEAILSASPSSAGIAQGSLAIASSTRWQPVEGTVQFTLTQVVSPPQDVRVWFRWQDASGPGLKSCIQSPLVQFVGKSTVGDDTSYTYSARFPVLDRDAYSFPWVEGLTHRSWTSAVPLVDMYVHANLQDDKVSQDDKGSQDPKATNAPVRRPVVLVGTVGVSTAWIAFVIAGALILLAWWCLIRWAKDRKVPGARFLRVISTPHGVASLSQFQIVIWTAVIGAGVIYVMMISGDLIDIPITTLGLLGVTGLTLVGSKLQANADGTPKRQSAPGVVSNLTVIGAPTSNTIVLNWSAPAGAEQPFSYTIQMRPSAGGAWSTVAHDIGAPPYAVTELAAGTKYDFQVYAISSAGAGPASVPVTDKTDAATAPAAGGPGQVTGFSAAANPDGTVSLTWSPLVPAPAAYVVQYRPTGTLSWATYSGSASTPTVVAGLESGTTFEFLVFAITNGVAGIPSTISVATTALRTPRWSDLVMSGDSDTEIDLTRVQMLLFTSIAAAFSGITLLDTGAIPNIPLGVLALVGLSNGVYLASKAVGPTR